MKKILVLSDTHSFIDDRIINYASKVDFVIHAGDIGNIDIIKKLKLVSKITALRDKNSEIKKTIINARLIIFLFIID